MFKGKIWLLIAAALFLAGCQDQVYENTDGVTNVSDADWGKVNDFQFTNQFDEAYGTEQLDGEYWIANFIFTRCPTVCLTMTPNMARVQEAVNEEGLDVEFVSFSVDPAYDTPDVLEEYGQDYGANFDNWNFLTGYDQEDIQELSEESFKQDMMDDRDSNDIIHGVDFFLVNDEREIIRFYDGMSPPVDAIVEDLKQIGVDERD
ncbi:SCO family protein [Salicibibacter cibarius]|uniref:SCO family protein n=2 Tax=Salicibibacter TaxID=2685905 RepID=A0A514LJD0_9BACI|nr:MULTISPECIES: SCO family protein [Salicibibacter]QDI91958.1 SCO family protein [Salicibibacter halophilus]QQK74493.1 SCO family protein [Salicibibacter cibarius]